MKHCYLMFNPESFQISDDKAHKIALDNIKYNFIHALDSYQNHSLFFKSKKVGYCFIFKKKLKKNGIQCYKNLLVMQDQKNKNKNCLKIGNFFILFNN